MSALSQAFHDQARSCAKLGSPFMESLCDYLAQALPTKGLLAQALAAYTGDIGSAGQSLPLRVTAGLHALVLTNRDPALAKTYPPVEAAPSAWQSNVLRALIEQERFLLDWIKNPPQTNEIRRSAALIPSAMAALAHHPLPIRLGELGASAGLNLWWDHYAVDTPQGPLGAPGPVIRFTPDWQGPVPPSQTLHITERSGVDLRPLDTRTAEARLRLMAYLWPDQPERAAMTQTALSLGQPPVAQGDAIDWLERWLATSKPRHLNLIQNTIAWQYFPPEAQAKGRALIQAAGASASKDAPLAWIQLEADGQSPGAALTLDLWPEGRRYTLGRACFHGRWITWQDKGTP